MYLRDSKQEKNIAPVFTSTQTDPYREPASGILCRWPGPKKYTLDKSEVTTVVRYRHISSFYLTM